MSWLKRRLYYLWITVSLVSCAVFFFPWFYPRESTSGILGRWLSQEVNWKRRFADFVVPVVDFLFHEPFGFESCEDIYQLEQAAREALYVRGELG